MQIFLSVVLDIFVRKLLSVSLQPAKAFKSEASSKQLIRVVILAMTL